MNPDILSFVKKQTAATLCCVDETHRPYCFAVFYAFDEKHRLLHYKSSEDTHHSRLLQHNKQVAGTIHPDKLKPILVQGIQFEGILLDADDPLAKNAFITYHKKHPLAIVKPAELWTIQISHIKMTDSTKGFGTKLHWTKEPSE